MPRLKQLMFVMRRAVTYTQRKFTDSSQEKP